MVFIGTCDREFADLVAPGRHVATPATRSHADAASAPNGGDGPWQGR